MISNSDWMSTLFVSYRTNQIKIKVSLYSFKPCGIIIKSKLRLWYPKTILLIEKLSCSPQMIDNNFGSVQFDRKRKRKRILDVVRSEKITSINQLARRLKRHVKNSYQDLKLLYAYDFVSLKKRAERWLLPFHIIPGLKLPIGKTDPSLDRAVA